MATTTKKHERTTILTKKWGVTAASCCAAAAVIACCVLYTWYNSTRHGGLVVVWMNERVVCRMHIISWCVPLVCYDKRQTLVYISYDMFLLCLCMRMRMAMCRIVVVPSLSCSGIYTRHTKKHVVYDRSYEYNNNNTTYQVVFSYTSFTSYSSITEDRNK